MPLLCRNTEGDILRLEVLRALAFTRPSAPTIKWLLPTSAPRKSLTPPQLIFYPPPPVLLLQPRHVATPFLAPPLHRPAASGLRMPEWGFVDRPETFGWAAEGGSLELQFGSVEARVVGGAWGAEERFDLVEAAAGLLPEVRPLFLSLPFSLYMPICIYIYIYIYIYMYVCMYVCMYVY